MPKDTRHHGITDKLVSTCIERVWQEIDKINRAVPLDEAEWKGLIEKQISKLRSGSGKSSGETTSGGGGPHIPIKLALPIPGEGTFPADRYPTQKVFWVPGVWSDDDTRQINWHIAGEGVSLPVCYSKTDLSPGKDGNQYSFPAWCRMVMAGYDPAVAADVSYVYLPCGTGGHWPTVSSCLDSLAGYRFPRNIKIYVIVLNNYTETMPWLMDHPNWQQIYIYGKPYFDNVVKGGGTIDNSQLICVTWPLSSNGIVADVGGGVRCVNGLWLKGGRTDGNIGLPGDGFHGTMGAVAYYNGVIKFGCDWPFAGLPGPFQQGRMRISHWDNGICASKGGVVLYSGCDNTFQSGSGTNIYNCYRGVWAVHRGKVIADHMSITKVGTAVRSAYDLWSQAGGYINAPVVSGQSRTTWIDSGQGSLIVQ